MPPRAAGVRKILGTVADWIKKYNISVYNETSRSGAVRHIYLRKAFATGEIMLCLVSAQENLPHTDKLIESLKNEKAIKSVLININPETRTQCSAKSVSRSSATAA